MRYATFVVRGLLSFGAAALLLLGSAGVAEAQTGTIRGVVRDGVTERPIFRAEVSLVGSQITVRTDEEGRYAMPNVPLGRQQVRVRVLGYTSAIGTATVTADVPVTLDFSLTQSVVLLDEVVVTGAGGAVERKMLGNTIATVQAEHIANAPVKDFSEAIAAREPGVQVLPSGGLPGTGARIRIRGHSSMSQTNEPVVYVDGVRVDNGGGFVGAAANTGSAGSGSGSRLDDIDPAIIERVEILKGAAAATLYGSEASAGVIQIFTKRGRAGAPRFNFRVDQGISQFPDVMKPQAGFARTQAQADQMSAILGEAVQPFQVVERNYGASLFGTGYQQSYAGDVSGGGEDVQYFISGRYVKDDGPITGKGLGPTDPTTGLPTDLGPGLEDINRRYHSSMNLTLFPRDRLQFRVGAMFTDTKQRTPTNNNHIYSPITLAMFTKPERGNCAASVALGLGGTYGENPNRPGTCAGPGNPWGNLAFATTREASQAENQADIEHFNGNLHASYQALTSLRFEATLGLDVTNHNDFGFLPFGNDVDQFTNRQDAGFKTYGNRNHRELSLDTKASWIERFGSLSSTFTGGAQGFVTRTKFKTGSGSRFPGPGINVASAGADQSVGEFFRSVVNIGLMAQEQIGFNDWVFLTVGGRWDRNSAFGENSPSAFYPKASISIIPSDLSSWGSELLSTVRVRAAFGRSGQQPGAFDKFTTFGALPSELGPGLAPDNLGNPNLKPEKTTEWEAGAEVGLFNNRAAIDVTRWRANTIDALVSRQFPVSGGFRAQQLDNIGELDRYGWDMRFNALLVDRASFSLNVFANAAFLRERVISLGGAPPLKVGGSYTRYRNFIIGPDTLGDGSVIYYAPGSHFGAKLLPQCGPDVVYVKGPRYNQPRPCWTPGQTVPYDSNRDGKPDTEAEFKAFLATVPAGGLDGAGLQPLMDDHDDDRDFLDQYLGKPTPDWQGAFGGSITIMRNLELSTLFEYKRGDFTVNNLTDGFRKSHPAIGRNTPEAAQVEATILNPASTADQRFEAAMIWAQELRALFPYSGMNMIYNADFVRWRELSLTYTPPPSFGRKFGLSNLAFNLTGRNLKLWTDYPGMDPEVNQDGRCVGAGTDCNFLEGIEAFGVPIPRRFTASVRFGF